MNSRKFFSVLFIGLLLFSAILFLFIQAAHPGNTNAAPISSWGVADYYPRNTFAENNHLDYNVEYEVGVPSIRSDPLPSGSTNYARESDSPWISISPGDTVVFSVWMKTSSSTLSDNGNSQEGARIGIDFYANGDITGTSMRDGSCVDSSNTVVPWGKSTWTQVTISFVVPSSYTDVYGGNYAVGQQVVASGCIPWVQVCEPTDAGQAWFANPQFYIS